MNAKQPSSLAINGHSKVTVHHLERRAYLYIRQSTLGQVLAHKASQYNQLNMVDYARQLGWQRDQIFVIQADQGITANGTMERGGFQELVAEVSLGRGGL